MKKYIFILFIALLVSSDSLWAYSESLMHAKQSERELLNNDLLNRVVFGSHRSVRELLEKGVDVNYQRENDGWTALIRASYFSYSNNFRIDIIRLLIEYGANVNLQDKDGYTALVFASYNGHTEAVKLLLANGADPDLQDNNRRTALMYASHNGHIEIVKLLLAAGAKVNLQDDRDYTALYYANREGYIEIQKLLREAGATE